MRLSRIPLVALLLALPGAEAYPPAVTPEPPYTTDAGGQVFNTIFWSSSGAPSYRVRCLLAGPDSGVVFQEPQFTRGSTNGLYFARPDLVQWTPVTGLSYSFTYPDPSFPFRNLLQGRLIRYQVNSVPDPLTLYGETASTQDNEGPWILRESFTCTNLHAGSVGNATGSVQIVDWPAGVMRAYVIWDYGSGNAGQAPMPAVGNDFYSFSIPPPPGGWGSMAGGQLRIRVHGVDNAADPAGSSSSYWDNESWADFYETVEPLGLPQVPVWGVGGPEQSQPSPGTWEGRSTTFRVQWSLDPGFGSIQGQTDVTTPGTYGSALVTGLANGARYWFRVGFQDQQGQFRFGEPTSSVPDYALPFLVPGSWTVRNLTEASTGPWTGSIVVQDIELEYPWGPYVHGTLTYSLGSQPAQTVALSVSGDPPGSPATFQFSVPEPPGGWAAYAGQAIHSMVVKVWDSAAPPWGFGPNVDDNTTYFYPPPETIDLVRPSIQLLAPQVNGVYTDTVLVVWNATDDQNPSGPDPDGDETANLTIGLSYRLTTAAQWTQIAQIANTASQPDSFIWLVSGLPEASQYALRAIATDPSAAADTAMVQPFTINRPDTPSITVLQPNGGEVILGVYPVRWVATDPDSLYGEPALSLRIDGWFSPDSGVTWQPMAWTSHLNDGEEPWNTSSLPDGSRYLVKLRVTDPRGLWREDRSDRVFTIDNNDPPDSVVLIAPNGGEVWYGQQTVRWYAHDPDLMDTLRIKLNYRRYDPQNPQFWNLIAPDAGNLPNTGSYVWSIPTYLQGYYEMLVVAVDRGGLTRADTCDRPFIINTPDPPTVRVISPNGGEFVSGTQPIRWQAADPDLSLGDTLRISLEISPDSGATWVVEASSLPNTGVYQWNTMTGAYPDAGTYLVRVCATDTFPGTTVCDVSDGVFYVLNHDSPPQVRVVFPNGGERVRDEVLIRWVATDPDTALGDTLAISLAFSPDSGGTWVELASSLANTGSWWWDIRSLEDGNRYLVRVGATDRHGITVWDTSDTTFCVFNDPDNPTVSLVSPNGGEHWSGTRQVRWIADDPDVAVGDVLTATLWVDSSAAPGFQALCIAVQVPGVPGVYEWDTAAWGLPDGDWYRLRIRITDSDSLSATDESDGPFLLFNNNDPPSISIVSPREGDIWKGVETIRWEAWDPDLIWGDTLAIGLYHRASPSQTWVPLAVGLANTGSYGWDTRTVPDGRTYQIRAVARDSSWASREAVSGVFAVENVNEPPLPFHLSFPREGGVVTEFKPSLGWTAAVDVDAGDRVTYQVVIWEEGGIPRRVEAGRDTVLTSRLWPWPLEDDTRYFWRVEATDSLGPATTRSVETWWFVTNVDGNDIPGPFHLLSPAWGALIHPDSVVFCWTQSHDQDVLDTVSYHVMVDTLPSLASARVLEAGGLLCLPLPGLRDNTTFFWAVEARDRFGGRRRSEELWRFTTDEVNDGPWAFDLLYPPEGLIVGSGARDTLTARWMPSHDADPLDTLAYTVVVVDSVHPADPGWQPLRFTLFAGGSTSLGLSAALAGLGERFADNRIYRWHVVATESRGLTRVSSQTWWFVTNEENEPPLVFDLVSPCPGCTLSTATPRLVWHAALDPDPLDGLTYRLEYDVDPRFITRVAHPGLADTVWEPREPFQDRGTVYWRVFAVDRAGAETRSRGEWSFVILPQATLEGLINYPNPFAAGREVTHIQYVLRNDAEVEILVFDLLGDPVWRWVAPAGTPGGRVGTNVVEWDGRNGEGRVVANGGYLCVVKARPVQGPAAHAVRKIAVRK